MNSYAGPDILLVVVVAVLVAGGVYLILERSLTRVAIGLIMLGNGINILFLLVSGPPGGPPIVGLTPPGEMSDPLPQAMVLTAIVITLALTSFLLAMAYRSWQLNEHDEVQDDLEDRRIVQMAAIDLAANAGVEGEHMTLDEEALEVRDEMADFTEEHWIADTEDDH